MKVADVTTDANAYGKIPKVDTLGVVNVGKAVKFHSSTDDATGITVEFDVTNLVFNVPIKGAFAGGVEKANSATKDSAGQQINSTYIKSITASNGTATVTYGDGHTTTFAVGSSSAGEATMAKNIPTSDVGGNIWIGN